MTVEGFAVQYISVLFVVADTHSTRRRWEDSACVIKRSTLTILAYYTQYLQIRLTLWFCGRSHADGSHVCRRIHML